MKVMTFNILTDGLPPPCERQSDIEQVIKAQAPDILCMQEGGDSVYWKSMADVCGFDFFVNNPGLYRPSLYVRGAVTEHRIYDQFHPGAIFARVQCGDRELRIINLHLPHKVIWDAERLEALQLLFDAETIDLNDDVLVCGDFNSRTAGETGDARQLEFIQANPEVGTLLNDKIWVAATDFMQEQGFSDCFRHLHDEPGYSVAPPVDAYRERMPDQVAQLSDEESQRHFMPPGVRIDYIFASPSMLKRLQRCDIIDDDQALESSDHVPFVAEFAD